MKSRSVVIPFLGSVVAIPFLFIILVISGGAAQGDSITLWLFGATVAIEVLAVYQAIAARKLFSHEDSGRVTWTLIVGFLLVRLIAEARLTSINFQLVPRYTDGASSGLFFYVIVLRYLYTLSDLLFIAALYTTIRSYKSTGLKFELVARDYFYMLLIWAMPALTFVFRENLIYSNTAGTDNSIASYRLVAVTVGAVIASLCIAIRRYVLQMGGGAVGKVWSMVVIAGISRNASFLVLALLSNSWRPGASFVEQYLLWIFACCWLIAALYQQEILPRVLQTRVATAAAESKV